VTAVSGARAVAAVFDLDVLPVPLVVVGTDGVIERANALAAALLGQDLHELVGQTLGSPTVAVLDEGRPLARALVHGESTHGERIRVEREDGSWLTIEANANPIRDSQGEIVAAAVVFWDLAERERRERAEREFITNAAHELQTPVASIVSAVEVLLAGAKDDPDDRERFLGHLDRESARLVRVLRSLLVLSRTQLGHEPVDLAPVRVRPLLDRVALALQPRRGIEVVVRCPAKLTVLSHDELLEQAVGNLAANSARHTAIGRIVLSAARQPEGVRIEVSDTGPGIDPDDVERLFERFTRGGGRDPEGFGLGLAIVRQITTVLGGTVSLAPRRGGGTVARIVLPESGREEP
jgi:two-component system, NtrC family, sensor histidine kinase KinB